MTRQSDQLQIGPNSFCWCPSILGSKLKQENVNAKNKKIKKGKFAVPQFRIMC